MNSNPKTMTTRVKDTTSFILRAKDVHMNAYSYEKSIYKKSSEKIIIICRTHGEFLQAPNSHISGHGCPKCRDDSNKNKQRMTHEEFINRCKYKHPGLLDYSKTLYINWKTPIIFICINCKNEYKRAPCHMLCDEKKHGCSKCNGGVKDTKETFVEKANSVHNNKYNYHLVEYVNSLTKVNIQCQKGHIFEQTPSHHINGDGCRRCHGHYRTQEDFITLSVDRYGDKVFDYSLLKFVNMGTPVVLICPNKHIFTVVPEIHMRDASKGGCKECANIENSNRMKYTEDQWIILATLYHSSTYDYSKVIYINSQTDICIICKIHGEFKQLPVSHIRGAGCQKCGFEKIRISKLLSESEIEQKLHQCLQIHKNRYTYNSMYNDNGRLMLEIICNKHSKFNQRLDHHIRGHGCYKCVSQYSKQQIEWLEYRSLSDGFIQHAENIGEFQIGNTFLHADGYSVHTNTVYEYQGDFWHGNPNIFSPTDINPRTNTTFGYLYERTQRKLEKVKLLGFNIVEIWESSWEKAKSAIITIQRKWKLMHLLPV